MPLTKFAQLSIRSYVLAIIALLCLAAGARAQNSAAPVVSKVEPPSWWAGHTVNPVRLLVRGANLHGARVTAGRAGTEASAVVVNPAGQPGRNVCLRQRARQRDGRARRVP
jgi:hypothetical protein